MEVSRITNKSHRRCQKKTFFLGHILTDFVFAVKNIGGLKSMELCHMIGRTPDGFIIVILYQAGLGLIRCQH